MWVTETDDKNVEKQIRQIIDGPVICPQVRFLVK